MGDRHASELCWVPHHPSHARSPSSPHWDRAEQDLLLALELTGIPVAICDHRGKVRAMNRLATRMVERGEVVHLENGALVCSGAELQVARALRNVAQTEAGHGASRAQVIRVRRSGESSPLTLVVYPLEGSTAVGPSRARALVVLGEPAGAHPSQSLVAELYGLTPSEARVAVLLAQGWAPAEISAQLRVTRETVKSHLRSLFSKTDTKGQVELVSKVLGGLGRLPRSVAF